jgi:hypothetical protein
MQTDFCNSTVLHAIVEVALSSRATDGETATHDCVAL